MDEPSAKPDSLPAYQALLAQIFNTIPQSVFWKDCDGVYLGCNAVFARAAGLSSPADVVGKTDFELPWPRAEAEAYRADDREVIEHNRPKQHIIEQLQRADGERIWIDTTKIPLTDAAGRPYGVLGVYEDITERRRTEAALRESEVQLRAIVDGFDGLIYVCSPDYRVEFMNPRFIERTGRNAVGELCYKALHGLDTVCPWCVNDRVFRGETVRWEVKSPKDGHWYYVVNTPIRHADGTMSKQAMIQDVTGRKEGEAALRESEARYRILFEESPVSLWEEDFSEGRKCFDELRAAGVTDFRRYFAEHPEVVARCAAAVRIVDVNKATLAMTGAGCKEELLGGLDKVFTPESLDVFREELVTLAEGGRQFVSEAVHGTLLGGRLSVLLWMTVVPGYEQTLGRVLVSVQDISARKAAEAALRQQQEDLGRTVAERTRELAESRRATISLLQDVSEQRDRAEHALVSLRDNERQLQAAVATAETANRELEAFSYSVSHDLRAPLRHVSGFVQLLQEEMAASGSAKAVHYGEVIATAAQKMGALIDDLLSFSRAGRTEMRLETVSLADLVAECRRELEGELKGRTVEWEVGELPAVRGDLALLRQVLANLLGNAVKYTRKRAVATIAISAKQEEGEVVVCVRDNGAGFDMRYVDKLFGVFQRLHAETEFEGTGIGLANVRRIIARHGGRTWAEGAVNQGATFYFTLPAEAVLPP